MRSPNRAFIEKCTADCQEPNGEGRAMFESSQRHCGVAFARASEPEFVLEKSVHSVGAEDSPSCIPSRSLRSARQIFYAAQIDGLLIDEINPFDRDEEFENLDLCE